MEIKKRKDRNVNLCVILKFVCPFKAMSEIEEVSECMNIKGGKAYFNMQHKNS